MTDKTLKYVIPKLNKTSTQISTTVTNDFAVIGVDRYIETDSGYIYANVSSLGYTYDGINYIQSKSGDILNGISKVDFNGYQWIACGYNDAQTESIVLSSDGINWTTPISNALHSYILDIVWGSKKWVAIGQVILDPDSLINRIAYSSDGMNWTLSTYNSNNHVVGFNCVAYNGSYFLAGGYNYIAKSTDGITWTDVNVSTILGAVLSITWNGSVWVGVGSNANPVAYSPNGVTWTVANTIGLLNSANTVVYNGTIFLVAGNGIYKLISSKDGITWIGLILYENESIPSVISDMTWTGSQWILIGNINQGDNIPKIVCSNDLITWTPSTNGSILYKDTYMNSITSRNRKNYFLTYT